MTEEERKKYNVPSEAIATIDAKGDAKFSYPPKGTTVNVGDNQPYKIPNGFMLRDQDDYKKGITPIPGGPADAQTPEQAGRTQMLRTAAAQVPLIKSLVFNKDKTINMENIATASLRLPRSVGRRLATAMEQGIQAITRVETGAAMPPQEVENTRKRFQPSVLDDDKTIKLKIEMFEEFIGGSLKLLDPSGRFDTERFNLEFEKRLNDDIPEGVTRQEWDAMPPEDKKLWK